MLNGCSQTLNRWPTCDTSVAARNAPAMNMPNPITTHERREVAM